MLQTNVSNQVGPVSPWSEYGIALTLDLSSALREHLLAQVQNPHATHKIETLHAPGATSPHGPHDHNIDPAIAGTGMMTASAGESGGDENSDGKKGGGKRELSTSKRAAQNRAAQVCCLN